MLAAIREWVHPPGPLLRELLVRVRLPGWKDAIVSILLAGFPLAISATLLIAAAAAGILDPHSPPSIDLPDDPLMQFLWVSGTCTIVPLEEELIFRGAMFSLLRDRMGLIGTTLLLSALFAIAHIPAGANRFNLFTLALLSVTTCVVRERTGSISAAAITHGCYNLLVIASIGWL
jgi:membrane protease YdiL (CAAX protease family)